MIGLALLASGCAGGDSDGAPTKTGDAALPAPALEKVLIVGSSWYGHAPAWVGIENGLFEKAGFAVEFRTVASSADRLAVIRGGQAQFASLGEIAMLTQMANGNESFYWVGNQNIAPGFEALVVRADVKEWSDLKGKTIGLQTISSIDITVRTLLKANGLDPRTDVKILRVDATEIPQTFVSNAVDAVAIWQPYLGKAMDAVPGSHALAWDTDTEIYKRFKTMTGPDVLVISREWTDADPPRARRLLAAYFEAVAMLAAKPEECARQVIAGGHLQAGEAEVIDAFKAIVWQGAEVQKEVMSDAQLFGQADHVCKLLVEDLEQIREVPDFRKWVKLDLLP